MAKTFYRPIHFYNDAIDLKPDNVGFRADGTCVLMDFGLATCVYSTRASEDVMYKMSGMTGSLRYMAPEVVLRQPYNEKADVYSYGILLWQMASDVLPFPIMETDDFIQYVAKGGLRPEIDPHWPPKFQNIIAKCFEGNPKSRASMAWVISELKAMINVDPKIARRMSTTDVKNAEKQKNCILS